MKICRTCKTEKPSNEYYVHSMMKDGRLNICKLCIKTNVLAYRKKNIDRIKIYDRVRRYAENMSKSEKTERVRRTRKWRALNRSKHNERQKLYRRGERYKAYNSTTRKLKHLKPDICSICNVISTAIHGHHPDYNKPLEVIWCCPSCHGKLHRKAV